MEKTQFTFRAIQMDLARQPETVEFIKKEIDFYKDCGYNFLVLYLEGRIRTEYFHPFPDHLSYTKEEMAEVVAYAAKQGLETIPVVSLLGHAEHFLMGEDETISELKNGACGRFNPRKHVFCPSMKETHEFIERYVTDIAEIFPSKYFHAGFDEAWDIGYCDICKKRLEKEGQSGIFSKHVNDMHALLTGKLGKTMMMWDDLFDIYPAALKETPRDVILCAWHYTDLEQLPYGHAGGPRRDQFKLYEEMGFKYIFAPASFSMRNIRTLTDYAAKGNAMGGLLTVWECPCALDLPSILYAGRLWSPDHKDLSKKEAISALTPLKSEEELDLAVYYLRKRLPMLPADMNGYLGSELNDVEYSRRLVCEAAFAMFSKYKDCGNDTMEELFISVAAEKIFFDLRSILPRLCNIHTPQDISDDLAKVKALAAEINARRKAIELKDRPDRPSNKNDRVFDYIEEMLAAIPEKGPLGNAVLRVRYPFGGSGLHFYVQYEGEDSWQWHEIKNVSNMGNNFNQDENLMLTPFHAEKTPAAMRIELKNYYVGCPIMYAEIETSAGRFVPAGITNIEGRIEQPEALLNDGRNAAFFGDGEVQAFRKFNDTNACKMVSCMDLMLKKA